MTAPGTSPATGAPFADVHAGQIERVAGKLSRAEIRDAAYTQVAVSAVAYQENRLAFARMLAAARDHGLTVDELVEASGRSESLVIALLRELD